ncbi:MAG: PAS domain S-box protein [Methanosarcina sp.]
MFNKFLKDRLTIAGSVAGFLTGFLAVVFMLAFNLLISGNHFSLSAISNLYASNDLYYILNLVPVAFGFAGAAAGRRYMEFRNRQRIILMQYDTILNRTVEYVQNIERKKLEVHYVPVNGEKSLAHALESMRESIRSASQAEYEQSETSRMSNELSAMVQVITGIGELGDQTIAFLVRNIPSVVQGAFYVVEGEKDEDRTIVMKAAYAYNRRKHLHAEFRFAQGLVGQAAVEKDVILRTEIPDDYMTVTSGLLGETRPVSLLIMPLISEEIVYGVIELASFSKFSAHQVSTVRALSGIIARSVANVKNSQRMLQLLSDSERMSQELTIQKKQLTRNSEALLIAQKELKEANIKLKEQIQEVHNAAKRTQVLLENSSEVIHIISEERKIIYVSPSIRSILGYYPEELLGMSDVENIHPLDTDRFRVMLSNLKSYPEKDQTIQFRYFTKGGDVVWMEASGKNLLAEVAIKGFVINSRDISGQRNAAREQRIRAKMQALSENSSDIIIRIDVFSRCTYINPVIEEFTGDRKDAYLDKPLNNLPMDPSVVSCFKKLLEETSTSHKKKTAEMIFPAKSGNRIMQVNAIPEFNENGEPESVLIVCHEITEAKEREELIRKKNKSIGDSINYAFNIQSALMPGEERLRSILPNSFMFYKPRDVVSGDYPLVYKDGDSIFIGAMDCTGHGVPGAMMSIIGYFLQDSILRKGDEMNAGDVLNCLHGMVVEKLKQAEPGSKINDGMDAALCRINLRKKVVDFAGAHRSLYLVSDDSLSEIKGDKFPVGSTQYRNRKEFINHTVNIKPGDSIYFMTDGYHDQFGGPTGKLRFTSAGVTELISNNVHLSIFQMGNLFRKTYEEWKGEVNQLDDVLVFGIKF